MYKQAWKFNLQKYSFNNFNGIWSIFPNKHSSPSGTHNKVEIQFEISYQYIRIGDLCYSAISLMILGIKYSHTSYICGKI